MVETTPQNIPYQPPQGNYSYIKPKTPLFLKLLYLFIGTTSALLLVGGFLYLLNFFNVISLTPFIPKTVENTISPNATYNPVDNLYHIKGIFYQFNNEKIKIKIGPVSFIDLIYTDESNFLISVKNINNTQDIDFNLGTLFDLDKNNNLGKDVEVSYTDKKEIREIKLFQGNLTN